ncbi:MAG: DUF4111 domain-containing protein [Actinobacteria bacterium]|nr:DUF4111 domain-containing protein [Actinomycetota bacterium]
MTPHPAPGLGAADRAQVDDVVDAVRRVLGGDLVGVYLYGSATSSGLRPESDVDLLAVVRSPLGPRVRPLLDAVLARSGRRHGLRPVELTVVVADRVRPWRYPPPRELQYGEWLRSGLEAYDPAAGGPAPWGGPVDPDLACLLTHVLLDGVVLVGPPAEQVLDPVPPADLRHAVADGAPGLLADLEDDTRNVLLTLARILATLHTDRIWSKDGAAAQVAGDIPADLRPLLELAAAAYRGEADDDWAPLLDDAERLAGHLAGLVGTAQAGAR